MYIVCWDCMVCVWCIQACGGDYIQYMHVLSVYYVCTLITWLCGLYAILEPDTYVPHASTSYSDINFHCMC